MKCAALFMAVGLASIWFFRLGMADHNSAIAPEMCGVAMECRLNRIGVIAALLHERVPVPGAVISGLIRPLPSIVTGPRLLKELSYQYQ